MDLFEETRKHKKRTHRKSYHIKKAKLINAKFRKHRKGWHYESNRHRLASKGIRTGHKDNFAPSFYHKERGKEELKKEEKKKMETQEPSETKEQINYLFQWQDLKGNYHTTEKKPHFWEHKGGIKQVPFESYMKSASIGQKFKKQTDEQKARLEKDNII